MTALPILWPTERFGLRLEGRFFGSVIDSDTGVFCVSSGGATCLIQSEADLLWQWEMTAGASWRFQGAAPTDQQNTPFVFRALRP